MITNCRLNLESFGNSFSLSAFALSSHHDDELSLTRRTAFNHPRNRKWLLERTLCSNTPTFPRTDLRHSPTPCSWMSPSNHRPAIMRRLKVPDDRMTKSKLNAFSSSIPGGVTWSIAGDCVPDICLDMILIQRGIVCSISF